MLENIIEHCERAKFVPELKKVVAELAAAVDERLTRLECVALEHAKLLDPQAFQEEPVDVEFTVQPAEAATDAPTDGQTTQEQTTEDTEDTEKA